MADRRSCWEILGLPPEATVTAIRERMRKLSFDHHPDRGGDPETFVILTDAYRQALSHAVKPRRCRACRGTGQVRAGSGFAALPKTCGDCRGTGKV